MASTTVHRLSTFIIISNLLICYLFIAGVTYLSLLSIVEVWSSWDDKVSPTVFSLGYLLSSYSYWLPLQSGVYQSSHVIDLWNFCFRWRQMVIHWKHSKTKWLSISLKHHCLTQWWVICYLSLLDCDLFVNTIHYPRALQELAKSYYPSAIQNKFQILS